MKRNEIVQRLINEGFNEKTLVGMNDKQLSMLSERILGEAGNVMISNKDPEKDKKVTDAKKANKSIEFYEDKVDISGNSEKRKEQVKQGAYDGRFKTKVVKDKKKEESKNLARKKVEVSSETNESKKSKNIKKKSLNLKKLEESDKNEVLEWIDKLVENDYHPVTTKNEIMELLQLKLNEGPGPAVADPDIDVEPDIEVEPDIDSPANPDTDPFVDPWDNPGVGPDPRPKFSGEKGMPEFLKFKEILQSINEKNDVESLSESIMREIKKVLKNG